MARGGYRPGGGRPRGSKSKSTIERELKAAQAQIELQNTKASGKKLAKEVLDDFMSIFAGMAAYYQPIPDGAAVPPGRRPNESKFENYARLAIQCAKDLARYQSPTYQAIMVAPAPEQNQPERRKMFQLTIFENPRAALAAPIGDPSTDAKH